MAQVKTKSRARRRLKSDEIDYDAIHPEATSLRAEFALDRINIEEASEVEGARWEDFQIVLLNDVSQLSIIRKSRQIAISFTFAAESWIEAFLYGTSSIFVSINREEASEKIKYVRRLYAATKGLSLPTITRDNEFSIGFANGAIIESLPSRPPRGKARRNVYLDEFAHVAKDREVYKGALPVISKGGKVRIGSSPMGARGLFWEIDTQAMQSYPGYRRIEIPWWAIRHFCTNVQHALVHAPEMETEERVEVYGTDIIKLLFANNVLEDFQQEYEAIYVDETASWIPWDEIGRCQRAELDCLSGTFRQRNVADAKFLIDEIYAGVLSGKYELAFAGGVDIGRTRNTTEIYIGAINTTGEMPLRLMITLDGVDFEDQKGVIAYALETLPIHTLLIDRNGLGMNIAEDLEHMFGSKVQGFNFSAETKRVLATDAKMWFQQGKVRIPKDRDLAYQIHSIRRKVSGTGIFIFDTDKNEKHHADKFWSLALLLHALNGDRGTAGFAQVITI